MSQVYSRSVQLNGDAGTVFDEMVKSLTARGFIVSSTERPHMIVADRGSLRPTTKIEKYPHTLVLAFHPSQEALSLSFVYLMSDFWHYTPGDRFFFDNEIDLFGRLLTAGGAKLAMAEEASMGGSPYIEELRRLAKLKDEGILSIDEFDQKKKKLLGI